MSARFTKYLGAAGVLMLLIAAFSVLALNGAPIKSGSALSIPIPAESVPPAAQIAMVADGDEHSPSYIVRDVGGVVGVYTPDGATLLDTLPILPAALRTVDAERLREGIEVDSDEALARLVEDFSS